MRRSIEGDTAIGLTQGQLDLVDRPERKSALPWRGQFSPTFVENLLKEYAEPGDLVCDPFVGSGTVLFESARLGTRSVGLEVNPAAIELANVAALASRSVRVRAAAVAELLVAVESLIVNARDLGTDLAANEMLSVEIQGLAASVSERTRPLLGATLLLAVGNGSTLEPKRVQRSAQQVGAVVENLPQISIDTSLFLRDSRNAPIEDASVDLVLTSPPYINVFNYHHNYRTVVESLGWDVLAAARSEIGSNRKNRSNRYLSVVQYCLDMAEAIVEGMRILRPGKAMILIVGRESNVLGTRFANAEIVQELSTGVLGLSVRASGERKFQNRFGKTIHEDILVLRSPRTAPELRDSDSRALGIKTLEMARDRCPEKQVEVLEQAIVKAPTVGRSPLLPGSTAYPSGQTL